MSELRADEGREACAGNAAPYVLGALAAEEHASFVLHLEACTPCREEVAELQTVADVLPAAAPQLEAPPQLRQRILEAVSADAAPRAQPRHRPRIWSRWGGAPWRPLAFAGLAAAAAALALALIALTGGTSTSTRVIPAEVLAPGANASLRVSGSEAQLDISGLPQTAPRQVYEVWVKRAGAPQPTDALFSVARSGQATVGVPGGISGVRTVMVTSEPLGGSRVPTTPPIIIANLG